jgi:hypothetical protein
VNIPRWRLEVLWLAPRPVPDGRFDRLTAELRARRGWSATRTSDGLLSVTEYVATDRPEHVLARLADDAGSWLRRHIPNLRLHAMWATHADGPAPGLTRSDVPPLASAADAAQILRVPRERVQQWVTERVFPAPVARVATGPLWTVDAVQAFRRSLCHDRPRAGPTGK